MDIIYSVCWGVAERNSDGNLDLSAGVFGVYNSKDCADRSLEDCKIETYSLACREANNHDVNVTGSIEDGYFKLSFMRGSTSVDIHITIDFSCLND